MVGSFQNKITADFTINKLSETFARFGLPKEVVSDNGTQFTSSIFKQFLKENGIRQILNAPGHPATNGAAENCVKTIKNALKIGLQENQTRQVKLSFDCILNRFLIDYRITKHCSTDSSPARLLFSRELRTRFHLLRAPNPIDIIQKKQDIQIANHKGKRVTTFLKDQGVWVRTYFDPRHPQWTEAIVSKLLGHRTYECELSNGKTIKRHLDQIRDRPNSDDSHRHNDSPQNDGNPVNEEDPHLEGEEESVEALDKSEERSRDFPQTTAHPPETDSNSLRRSERLKLKDKPKYSK